MTTTQPTATITVTLVQSLDPASVAVVVNDETIGFVKDGGHIVRNVDRVLAAHGLRRLSGYSLNAGRQLTATGYAPPADA